MTVMKITLDQPTFLTALTSANTNPATPSTDDNFLNFLTELLGDVLPAETEVQEGALPSTEPSSNPTDTAQTVSDESTVTLDNLLIGMNYLAQVSSPTSTPTPTPIPTPTIQNEKLIELTQKTATDVDPTTVSSNQTTVSAGSIPSMPLPKTLPTPALNSFESNKLNSIDKSARSDRDSSVRQDETAFLNSLAASIQPSAEHEQKAKQTLNQLADWIQVKINADPSLAVLPLPSLPRAATERAISALKTDSTAIQGAATPANAAWEAKVEVQQTVSNAEINLAHYQANIKIYPPELGKVSAKLKMDKNSATLVVTAETKEVKALIETNLAGLREQFANSNIQLDRIEVTLADNKGNTNTDANARRESKQEKAEGMMESGEAILRKPSQSKQKQSDNAVDAYV